MTDPGKPDATEVLAAMQAGDAAAGPRLMDLVYDQLRAMAAGYFRNQPAAITLEPTALVHEVFLRMVDQTSAKWNDRAHFLAVCAVAMRGILADHARRRRALKRGGDWERVALTDVEAVGSADDIDLLALDEALTDLAQLSERQARVVEYRYFGGLTMPEIAEALGVAKSTVDEDWRMARAWLSIRFSRGD
jgi:RNA polymerase sigma factor (TIGR02999 family)